MAHACETCNLSCAGYNTPNGPVNSSRDMSHGCGKFYYILVDIQRWQLLELNDAICDIHHGSDQKVNCV